MKTVSKQQVLDGNYIEVKAGKVFGRVYGGPFRNYLQGTRRLVGVKMAREIKWPNEIDIPTLDFSVPDKRALTTGIMGAFGEMANGNDVYVGCMGGKGRTGIFMAVMVKALKCYQAGCCEVVGFDPVEFVRGEYDSHAVETREQEDFVDGFNVDRLVSFLEVINQPPKAEVVTVVKTEYIYPQGLWGHVKSYFSGH